MTQHVVVLEQVTNTYSWNNTKTTFGQCLLLIFLYYDALIHETIVLSRSPLSLGMCDSRHKQNQHNN